MECAIRVSGKHFDVDGFAEAFPRLRSCALWRAGAPRHKGKHLDSGLAIVLAEGESWQQVRHRVHAALPGLRKVLVAARRAGADVAFDFALFVGDVPYTSSLSFSAADLEVFQKLGASVDVSAYPVTSREREHVRRPKRVDAGARLDKTARGRG